MIQEDSRSLPLPSLCMHIDAHICIHMCTHTIHTGTPNLRFRKVLGTWETSQLPRKKYVGMRWDPQYSHKNQFSPNLNMLRQQGCEDIWICWPALLPHQNSRFSETESQKARRRATEKDTQTWSQAFTCTPACTHKVSKYIHAHTKWINFLILKRYTGIFTCP